MNWRAKTRGVRRVAGAFATVGVVALAQVYDYVTRPRPRTVRKLAGSRAAQTARETTELRLRDVVHHYGALPSLTLRMLAMEDICAGGGGWSYTSDGNYKVACTLYVTAYYSSNRDMHVVLDDILTAGDAPASRIAFSHSNQPHITAESHWLFGIGQTVTWDTPAGRLVDEARPCMRESDPPVYRCLHEGDAVNVAAIRSAYGSVLQLDLNPVEYFRIDRSA